MVTTSYAVEGLTCGSCLAEVLEHVHTVVGVSGAAVDLVVGGASLVVVTSGRPVSAEHIRAAVERAGFVLMADSGRAACHDHAREDVLAAGLTELDNSRVLTGGVR